MAAQAAAVAADHARTALFAAVSHDLRTPVHTLLAAADQLRDASQSGNAALLDAIDASAHELLERLDELLTLSGPPAQPDSNPTAVNVNDVVASALADCRRRHPTCGSPASIRVDPALNREVLVAKAELVALVDVLLAELVRTPKTDQVRLDFTLGEASLDIAMSGLVNYPADGSPRRVRHAIDAIAGATDSTSDSDTLRIRVPVARAARRRSGIGRRVLLVDDTAVPRQLGEAMVRSLGYEVDTADGGLPALAALSAADYALVLMDVRMPDLDGLSAAKAIRAGEAGRTSADVPIVALTADAVAGGREQALLAGMDDYLTKPFSRAALAQVLARFIASPAQIAS